MSCLIRRLDTCATCHGVASVAAPGCGDDLAAIETSTGRRRRRTCHGRRPYRAEPLLAAVHRCHQLASHDFSPLSNGRHAGSAGRLRPGQLVAERPTAGRPRAAPVSGWRRPYHGTGRSAPRRARRPPHGHRQQDERPHGVLRHAGAVRIEHTQVEQRARVALARGTLEPARRLRRISGNAAAAHVARRRGSSARSPAPARPPAGTTPPPAPRRAARRRRWRTACPA